MAETGMAIQQMLQKKELGTLRITNCRDKKYGINIMETWTALENGGVCRCCSAQKDMSVVNRLKKVIEKGLF